MPQTRSPQPPLPRAIVVSGPAGSGKTSLGTALAARLGYAIVDLDTVTGPLARFALEQLGATSEDFDSPAGQRLRGLRYTALLNVAQSNLALGLGVVVTAPFTRESHHEASWSGVCAWLGAGSHDGRPGDASVALIYLEAPPEVLNQRLLARGEPRDRSKLSRGPLAAAPDDGIVAAAIRLDATLPVESQMQAALRALTAWRGVEVASPTAC